MYSGWCHLLPFSPPSMFRGEIKHKSTLSDYPEENYPAQISRNCFQFYLPWFLDNRLLLPSFRSAGNMQPEGAALQQQALLGMVLLANSLQLYCACSTHWCTTAFPTATSTENSTCQQPPGLCIQVWAAGTPPHHSGFEEATFGAYGWGAVWEGLTKTGSVTSGLKRRFHSPRAANLVLFC